MGENYFFEIEIAWWQQIKIFRGLFSRIAKLLRATMFRRGTRKLDQVGSNRTPFKNYYSR